jgi:YggT family protein
MLFQIIELVVGTIAAVIGTSLLLRAYLQRVGAGRNPLAQFSIAVTNWIVLPLRRMVKPRHGVDWASLIAALLIALAQVLILTAALGLFGGYLIFDPVVILIQTIQILLAWAIWMAIALTFLWAIISWVNPDSPMGPVLDELVAPLLRPIRRVMPRVGGFDLSPMVLILLLLILRLVIDNGAAQLVMLAG